MEQNLRIRTDNALQSGKTFDLIMDNQRNFALT